MRKLTCLLGLEPRLPLRLQVKITSQQYRLSTHVPQRIEVACRPDIWRPRCTTHAPKLPHIRRAQPLTSTCMPTRTSLGALNAECSMLSAQRGYAPDASAKAGPSSTPAAHEGAILPVTGLEHELEQRQLIPVHLCRGREGASHTCQPSLLHLPSGRTSAHALGEPVHPFAPVHGVGASLRLFRTT